MVDEFGGDGVKKAGAKKGVKKAGKKGSSAKKAAPAKKAGPGGTKAAKKAAKKATSSPRAAKGAPTHAEIAERAYYIQQHSGGSAEENWHQAERELSEE